jgi:hypothetical protein
MEVLYGYSLFAVTWTEEIKQRFYPTYSTPVINSKALWSKACVGSVAPDEGTIIEI